MLKLAAHSVVLAIQARYINVQYLDIYRYSTYQGHNLNSQTRLPFVRRGFLSPSSWSSPCCNYLLYSTPFF